MGFNLKGIRACPTIKHYFELEGCYTMKDQFVMHQIFELRTALIVRLKLYMFVIWLSTYVCMDILSPCCIFPDIIYKSYVFDWNKNKLLFWIKEKDGFNSTLNVRRIASLLRGSQDTWHGARYLLFWYHIIYCLILCRGVNINTSPRTLQVGICKHDLAHKINKQTNTRVNSNK